jgi:hypothetical protein
MRAHFLGRHAVHGRPPGGLDVRGGRQHPEVDAWLLEFLVGKVLEQIAHADEIL